MNASNKITLTIVLIFTAVFSLLAVAMFYQARADISEEGEAALQLAETLAKAEKSHAGRFQKALDTLD